MTDYAVLSDAELNAAVAEMMGWQVLSRQEWNRQNGPHDETIIIECDGRYYRTSKPCVADIEWNPASSWDGMRLVVEQVKTWDFEQRAKFFNHLYACIEKENGSPVEWTMALLFLTPRAVCLAALKAVEGTCLI